MTSEQLRLAIIKEVLSGKLTKSKNATDFKPIDDDLFDMYQIPSSWDIVSLEDSCYIHARIGWQALRKEEHQTSGDYLLVTGTDFKDGLVDYRSCVYISKERYDMDEKIQLQNDDILITKDGSIGKVAVVKNLPKPATLNAGVFVIRPDERFEKRYIEYLFQCSYFNHFVNLVKSGTTIKHLNQNKLLKFKIPVPTIDEQNEIVDVLDKLLPYVDRFDSIDKQLSELNNTFPSTLKKSILQQAVMGKLVPQDPNDEPASVLLDRICAEKAALIKAGKLKKNKHESIIYRRDNSHYEKVDGKELCIDDEIPFDIPDTWVWTRFSNLAKFENGDRSNKYPVESDYVEDGIPFFGAKDMSYKYMSFDSVRFISKEKYNQLGNGKLVDNDMICLLRGNVGKTSIFKRTDKYSTGFICAQMLIIRCLDISLLDYLYMVISSPYYAHIIKSKITGTAVHQLPAKEVANILIPLPPKHEQARIMHQTSTLLCFLNSL